MSRPPFTSDLQGVPGDQGFGSHIGNIIESDLYVIWGAWPKGNGSNKAPIDSLCSAVLSAEQGGGGGG